LDARGLTAKTNLSAPLTSKRGYASFFCVPVERELHKPYHVTLFYVDYKPAPRFIATIWRRYLKGRVMALGAAEQTGLEKWKATLNKAPSDKKWGEYDCEIRVAVNEINTHLARSAGYVPLDWQLIKAMVWTETGAEHPQWKIKPMQIGVPGDPGLASLLSGKEGGELILPPSWKGRLNIGSCTTIPSYNIRAGIGYLLMRMAIFDYRSVPGLDTKVYEIKIKPGDSLDKIAKASGTTVESLKKLNPSAAGPLRPGHLIKYRKASVERVIAGWRVISTSSIALRYNGGGDPNYAKKLDYALNLVRKAKAAVCAQ
jgi:hypothetical protein